MEIKKNVALAISTDTVALKHYLGWNGTKTYYACKSDDGFEYFWNDTGGIIIYGYSGESKSVIIPSRISRYTVTEIGYGAFQYKKITSVIIPDSVIKIGAQAFNQGADGWNFTSVTIGANVQFDDRSGYGVFAPQLADDVLQKYYKSKGSKAGTYTRNRSKWSFTAAK